MIREKLSRGIEKVDTRDLLTRRHIPHHAVINPNKNMTKIRNVHDASAKRKNGMRSLNEYLSRGPIILEDMFALLQGIGQFQILKRFFCKLGYRSQTEVLTDFSG